jgi:hypothetical protein
VDLTLQQLMELDNDIGYKLQTIAPDNNKWSKTDAAS